MATGWLHIRLHDLLWKIQSARGGCAWIERCRHRATNNNSTCGNSFHRKRSLIDPSDLWDFYTKPSVYYHNGGRNCANPQLQTILLQRHNFLLHKPQILPSRSRHLILECLLWASVCGRSNRAWPLGQRRGCRLASNRHRNSKFADPTWRWTGHCRCRNAVDQFQTLFPGIFFEITWFSAKHTKPPGMPAIFCPDEPPWCDKRIDSEQHNPTSHPCSFLPKPTTLWLIPQDKNLYYQKLLSSFFKRTRWVGEIIKLYICNSIKNLLACHE